MPNYNSIFNDAIYALSGRKHIENVSARADNDLPDFPYLLCKFDCPGNRQQTCHIYPSSDDERLIVAGELALDVLKDDIYRKAETIAKKYDLQITEDQIGENNVFSETVPLDSYKWKLYDSVLNVARAEKEFLKIKRT